MRNTKLLEGYFCGVNYRHVRVGEKIEASDVFVVNGMNLHPATDIGNGVMSPDHWPHYRKA